MILTRVLKGREVLCGLTVGFLEDTNTTAYDALRKGLEDMIEACDVVTRKFEAARDEFDAKQV